LLPIGPCRLTEVGGEVPGFRLRGKHEAPQGCHRADAANERVCKMRGRRAQANPAGGFEQYILGRAGPKCRFLGLSGALLVITLFFER
jgi:hypothetical protein